MNLTKKFLFTWIAVHGQHLDREVKFHPFRKWRFDFGHPSGIAIELEGGVWTHGRHTNPAGFVKDIEKYNEAALLGWTVLRLHQGNITVTMLERIKKLIERRTNDKRNQGNDADSHSGEAGEEHRGVQDKSGEGCVRDGVEVG